MCGRKAIAAAGHHNIERRGHHVDGLGLERVNDRDADFDEFIVDPTARIACVDHHGNAVYLGEVDISLLTQLNETASGVHPNDRAALCAEGFAEPKKIESSATDGMLDPACAETPLGIDFATFLRCVE